LTRQPVVLAENLIVEYPGRRGRKAFRALDGVNLRIDQGEVLGLVGESGSGKTTFGRAIAGLTAVTGGSLRVLGHQVGPAARGRGGRPLPRSVRGRIGFVFQDPATSFNPLLTIGESVAEPLLVHRRDLAVTGVRERVAELLGSVQLSPEHAGRFPHELSGGQRQRAGIARALALDPLLLIADEPTSALDVSVQAKILELLRELQQRYRFATLFISHDLAVVDQLADRVAILYRGKVVETGPAQQVLSDPQDPYTRRLIASIPVPDPAVQSARRKTTPSVA
jgi:peptide/nickel transport system ATP-binding protein